MGDKKEETIWIWMKREVWIIGVVLFCVFFFYNQINDLKIQQALTNQKLDTVITQLKQHENDTVRINDQLNLTFSDIYLKLGSRYIPNSLQQ